MVRWFPFSGDEIQMCLAVLGAAATIAALAGVSAELTLWGAAAGAVVAYIAGLAVHARGVGPRVTFLRGGAEKGDGYMEAFRSVHRCLYLVHLDDDPPGPELQALYRGVQIRRLVMVREDATCSAYQWIVDFGDHPNLQHAVVVAERASLLHMGFVLVDGRVVLLSVPGHEAIDGKPYSDRLVLRHLLRIDDAEVAGAFLRIHEDLWARARVLSSSAELLTQIVASGRPTASGSSVRGLRPER